VGFSLYTVADTDAMQSYNTARAVVSLPSSEALATLDKYRAEHLFVMDAYAMFYLSELDLKNDYRGQAIIDCFFKEDFLNIVSQLEEYDGRVFLTTDILYRNIVFSDGETFNEKLLKVLNERFVSIAEEGYWYVYDYAGG
jgi:hypothetical protein